jgi:hypothetical protein
LNYLKLATCDATGSKTCILCLAVPVNYWYVDKPHRFDIDSFVYFIYAEHIIILSLVSLILYSKPTAVAPISGAVVFMSVLEMLVAALQAYIFTLLTALFIGRAVEEHDHH